MKGKSLIEVLIFYFCMLLIGWLLKPTDFIKMELEILGWSYFGGILMIGIPLAIILISKRNLESYGLTKKHWEYALDIGLTSWIFLAIPAMVLFMFSLNYSDVTGALILSGITIAILILILKLKPSRSEEELDLNPPDPKLNFTILIVLLFVPIFLGIFYTVSANKMGLIVSTTIWQFFISGFGEEIKFRGYIQSRINEEFGRPYRFLGVDFGPGLIIASFLFGLQHVFNPFSPFEGIFLIDIWWGVWTFFTGLFFGFLREKTGSLIAPGISHGSDAFGEALMILFS